MNLFRRSHSLSLFFNIKYFGLVSLFIQVKWTVIKYLCDLVLFSLASPLKGDWRNASQAAQDEITLWRYLLSLRSCDVCWNSCGVSWADVSIRGSPPVLIIRVNTPRYDCGCWVELPLDVRTNYCSITLPQQTAPMRAMALRNAEGYFFRTCVNLFFFFLNL